MANDHVGPDESERAHHVTWSMRRFRRRSGETVGRLIENVRERIVAEGIADGSIRSCDPRMLSFAMFGAFNWLSYWYDENGRKSPEMIAEDFLDFFFRGVGVKGGTRNDAGS